MSELLTNLNELLVRSLRYAEDCRQSALVYSDDADGVFARWKEHGLAHEVRAEYYEAVVHEVKGEIALLNSLQERHPSVMNELLAAACDFSIHFAKYNELLEHLRWLYGYYDPPDLPWYDL
jgi:hypothetical protein